MDIYDTSIMDPDPPRPDESSPQRPESSTVRPEDHAPPPPADGEEVSPTLAGLKTVGGAVGGAALAGLGAVKNVAAGLAATVLDDLLEPEQSEGGALDDVLRRMSGDEDGDAHAQTALQIARNGGLEVTAQAMAAHQDDARIQALACAVLGHTCRNAPHRREGRAALPHVVRALATPDAFIDVPFDDERCHAMACYALAAVCAGDREAAEAAAKLGAPALVDHALRRFAKRASVERWGAHAKAALAGPGAAPLGAAPPAGLNIGPPVVAQSVPPAWTPGAFP